VVNQEPKMGKQRGRTGGVRSGSCRGLAVARACGLVCFAAGAAVSVACSSSEIRTGEIAMDRPRATSGMVIDEPTELGMMRIAQALDGLSEPPASASMLASARARAEMAGEERQGAETMIAGAMEGTSLDEPGPEGAGVLELPPAAGRLLALERMSRFELGEVITTLGLRFKTELGYLPAGSRRTAMLGAVPREVTAGPVLTKGGADGSFALLRLGSMRFASQLPQLWAQGVTVAADGTVAPNPDLAVLEAQVAAAMEQVRQMRQGLSHTDLDRQLIKLSYTTPAGAINALKGMGVSTVPAIEELPATLEFAQLPMVAMMPAPGDTEMALLGDASIGRGQFGVSVATNAAPLNSSVNTAPTTQLLVLYHPAHPEQLSLVRSMLQDFIDRPARQILVEGMVLEISEDGLEELGVQWEFKDGPVNLVLGTLDPRVIAETLDFSAIDSRDLASDWGLKIQALVRDGRAEVLSRPSVLTIDNRQASIRVGEDIPIATSTEGTQNSNKISFNFQYIPTGILLNIRPRMNETGEEVSMLVDTIVSAQVPGRDLEIRAANGDLLASAPTISTRRVQTYARIDNKTPFIIGGLVSRDRSVIEQKVPFLGDLPLIGNAFKSTRTSSQKREVIIVLTPYVLPEDDQAITRALPQDDDLFDSAGNRLFRDAYRIRGEDVFDLSFLADNKRLTAYRDLSREVIANNFRLAQTYPFSEFAQTEIPGEELLIQRMIYEVIKRTEADARVNPDRMIYFEAEETEGYRVRFLADVLGRLGTGEGIESFFERNTGKALAVTFRFDPEAADMRRIASEPIPEIALIDCPDRATWSRLLWEMNQPEADGTARFSFLVHDARDIVRLQRAMMMKQIIELNTDGDALSLKNFRIGKILHIPSMDPDKVTVIDSDVARYFFISELYYAALIQRIEETINRLDSFLRDPEIRVYLNDAAATLPAGGE
jgi:general secretion pathway protein D